MIYLFDDNEFGQMSSNYGIDIIEALKGYSEIIRHFTEFPDLHRIEELILNAEMIFIHYSFSPPDINERICFLAEDKQIPLVVFSGGEPITIFDDKNENVIRKMKKDRFYFNLIPFLQRYKKNKENVSLKELVYGDNYEIERSLLIQDYLFGVLISSDDMADYGQLINSGSKKYKDLHELFYLAYGKEFEEQFSGFDEDAFNNSFGIKEIAARIKKLVKIIREKYEK